MELRECVEALAEALKQNYDIVVTKVGTVFEKMQTEEQFSQDAINRVITEVSGELTNLDDMRPWVTQRREILSKTLGYDDHYSYFRAWGEPISTKTKRILEYAFTTSGVDCSVGLDIEMIHAICLALGEDTIYTEESIRALMGVEMRSDMFTVLLLGGRTLGNRILYDYLTAKLKYEACPVRRDDFVGWASIYVAVRLQVELLDYHLGNGWSEWEYKLWDCTRGLLAAVSIGREMTAF